MPESRCPFWLHPEWQLIGASRVHTSHQISSEQEPQLKDIQNHRSSPTVSVFDGEVQRKGNRRVRGQALIRRQHTDTHVHAHTETHIATHVHTHGHALTHMYTHNHTYMPSHTVTHVHAHTYMRVHVHKRATRNTVPGSALIFVCGPCQLSAWDLVPNCTGNLPLPWPKSSLILLLQCLYILINF